MHRRAFALLVVTAALAGCTDRDRGERAAGADSALARDLELATQDAPELTPGDTALGAPLPAAPEPAPVPSPRPTPPAPERPTRRPSASRPATPRPTTASRPAPAPAPSSADQSAPAGPVPAPTPTPEPRSDVGTLAAGTAIGLATNQRVCTTSNRVGDKLTATVSGNVVGTNGLVVPDGSKAVLEIASITRGAQPESTQIAFRVRAMYAGERPLPVTGEVAAREQLEKTRTTSKGSDAKKVIGGAVAGAILGQVLGRGTGATVIGAAAGAAAGTAAAKVTEGYEGCLPAGSALRFTLAEKVEAPLQ